MLGYVFEDAKHRGLGVHSMTREQQDGTVIIAEKIGSQPRATIIPGPLGPKRKPVRAFKDLVISNGAAAYNEAAERIYPPIILSPEINADETAITGWKSYFFNADAPGKLEDSGIYLDVYPNTIANEHPEKRELIDGQHIWWNDQREYFSFRKTSSYWASAYRHPFTLFTTDVFHLGHTAFNADTYLTAEEGELVEKHVLGAAMREGWLYCLMADLGYLDYTPRPAEGEFMHDAWMSPQFANTSADYVLRRFRLKTKEEPNGVQHYVVIDGSHEDIWAASLTRAYAPWCFNADCTGVVSYQIPAQTNVLYRAGDIEDPPSGPGDRFSLAIAVDEFDGTASAIFSTEGAGDRIAEDGGPDGWVAMSLVKNAPHSYSYNWGADQTCEAYSYTAGPTSATERRRTISHFDLRVNRGVFWEIEQSWTLPSGTTSRTARVIVWDNGVETEVYSDAGSAESAPYYVVDMHEKIRDDWDATGLAGLPLLYMRVAGVVITSDDTPEDDVVVAGIYDLHLLSGLCTAVIGENATSNGGASLSNNLDDEATSWPWDYTVGVGPGGSIAPQHPSSNRIFYVNNIGISTDLYTFYSSVTRFFADVFDTVNFLTQGDIQVLCPGAVPADLYFDGTVLGKPPKTMPTELPE